MEKTGVLHQANESGHLSESGSSYWQIQLDRDLVETISAILPEWLKTNMADGGQQPQQQPPSTPRASPPKAIVDTSPLLNSMEQNKEYRISITLIYKKSNGRAQMLYELSELQDASLPIIRTHQDFRGYWCQVIISCRQMEIPGCGK
ncbi:hypothetical protein QE152_g26614 [Popillia japonica]|uniref:Uncharacterized protein n=1 Tax=Popillia japonica TaxID=7064 RepID=A0AAW1JXS9_POPJA